MPLTKITNIEGYQKHTHTISTEPTIVAQSGSRLFEAIDFGHEMSGAINTHTEPTWHSIGSRAFECYQKHTHTHNFDRTDHCGAEWIAFAQSSA